MRKINLAYLSDKIHFYTCVHAHAVPYGTSRGNPISPYTNINLHVTRDGHWISPREIVYTMQDLAVKA